MISSTLTTSSTNANGKPFGSNKRKFEEDSTPRVPSSSSSNQQTIVIGVTGTTSNGYSKINTVSTSNLTKACSSIWSKPPGYGDYGPPPLHHHHHHHYFSGYAAVPPMSFSESAPLYREPPVRSLIDFSRDPFLPVVRQPPPLLPLPAPPPPPPPPPASSYSSYPFPEYLGDSDFVKRRKKIPTSRLMNQGKTSASRSSAARTYLPISSSVIPGGGISKAETSMSVSNFSVITGDTGNSSCFETVSCAVSPYAQSSRCIPSTKITTASTLITDISGGNDVRKVVEGNAPFDDRDGHYIVCPESFITSRYKVLKLLGQGTFGKVAQCWDYKRSTQCAVKIIRAVQKYRDASQIEIRVLKELEKQDPLNLNRCIHMLDCFDYRNHVCMVFELLGESLFDFLKSNGFQPFPLAHIQRIGMQLINAVAFLHRIGLIHTDLKPENILLKRNNYRLHQHRKVLIDPEICLIDFGSAVFHREYHSQIVSTRHYRAPEIIIGSGWSFPCDLWSVGCIMVEMWTGEALFQTHDNLEHLAMMETMLGPIPWRFIQTGSRSGQGYFEKTRGVVDYPRADTTTSSQQFVRSLKPLNEVIMSKMGTNGATAAYYFLDLVKGMLVYDPRERMRAEEALQHPFFQQDFSNWSSTNVPRLVQEQQQQQQHRYSLREGRYRGSYLVR